MALGGPFVAYLGAHTGCGCGFREAADEDAADTRTSLSAFCACAAAALRCGQVGLFIGWEGDQSEPNVDELTLDRSEATRPERWHEPFARGFQNVSSAPMTGWLTVRS